MACWVVAQKVPSSCVRGMYDAQLGAGDEWGRLTSSKCIYSCLVDYDARETSGSGVLLCALEALCQAAETAVSWAFLLVKLD